MDDICIYNECNAVLNRLITKDEPLFRAELEELSPNYADYIIHDFEEKCIAKWDGLMGYFSEINKEVAVPLFHKMYYEKLYDNSVANKKRDELAERNTISVEKSAKWAEQSAEASLRSAESAEKANIFAEKSDIRSKNANCIAIVSIVVSLIGILISLLTK